MDASAKLTVTELTERIRRCLEGNFTTVAVEAIGIYLFGTGSIFKKFHQKLLTDVFQSYMLVLYKIVI